MFGWYSESIAKMGDVHICKDKHYILVLCTSITNTNQCPYLEESVFGSDVISIGELKEYVSKMKYESYN